MGRKIYCKTSRDTSPGPCAYNPKIDNRPSTPSWTIHGVANRITYKADGVPRPGAYDPTEEVKKSVMVVEWSKIEMQR